MTKREQVKAAIAHQKDAAVPYCIDITLGAGEKIKNYYPEGDFTLFPGEGYEPFLGNHVHKLQCPWWVWGEIPESYKGFDPPNDVKLPVRGWGSYEKFEERLNYIKETSGAYIVACIWGGNFEKSYVARGMENFLADLVGEKEFAGKLLDMCMEKTLVMLDNILSYPQIDGVLMGSDWGTQKSLFMGPDLWREMIGPRERRQFELIKKAGKDVWVHSCGDVEEIIPDLINMGVDVLNPIQSEAMDIFKIKREYGDKITFWGGCISTQTTLPFGTPDEVRKEMENTVSFMSKGGGYITGPTQIVTENVPAENIVSLLETAKKFAQI